jgi:spore coat protein U-like protein
MSMKSTFSLFALGISAFCPALRPALAATSTASIAVTVTVESSCQVSTADLTSATYMIAKANPTSSVSVICDRPTAYNVGLSAGVAPDAPTITRVTTGPGSALPGDAMPPDPAHTINRGQADCIDTVAGTNSAKLRSVDGRIAGPVQPAPGADADTVFVTIIY